MSTARVFRSGGRWSHRHAQGFRGPVRSGPGPIVVRAAERAPVLVLQRPAQSVEVLVWDGSGLWVCAKRLEKGRFTWPQSGDAQGKVILSYEELSLLLGGIDLSKTKHKRWYRKAPPEGHAAA
jgi:transposase